MGVFRCCSVAPLATIVNKDKTLWRRERNQFAADNTNLREINAKLTADNAELTEALLTSRESFAVSKNAVYLQQSITI